MRRLYFSERQRQKDLAEKEAKGQSFWSTELNLNTRNKIIYALNNLSYRPEIIKNRIRYKLMSNYGVACLHDSDLTGHIDYDQTVQKGEIARVLDLIEATYFELYEASLMHIGEAVNGAQLKYETAINDIFLLDRNSYTFREGQIHQFSEQFSYEEILFPAINLLNLKSEYVEVNIKYKEALEEISRNKPADAITDAGTALQIYLEIKGFPGKVLGDQIKALKISKTLSGLDMKLLDVLVQCVEWISGVRNQKSDAHPGQKGELEDAWLVLRILGSLILRLESL